MEINNFYYNIGRYNFGDSINKIFFKKLLNNNKLNFKNKHNELHYITTGSVLECANKFSIVYGTGFISINSNIGMNTITGKGTNKVISKPYKIISVRGPKTRKKLLLMNIECTENYGDPLLLFPIIYNNFNIKENKNKIGIIPHYIDKKCDNLINLINNLNKNNFKINNIDIILPKNNYKNFIDNILECEYIISSSLHGVMMGLIYRKKTIFLPFSNKVVGNNFKFFDFFESLNIEYKIKLIYNINILNNIIMIDYNKLKNIINNMIEIAPFINNKDELKNKYNLFHKQYL